MISQLLWIFPALRIVVFSAKHGRVNARAQAAIGYNVPPLYFVSSCPLLKGWMNFSINIKCNSTLSCTWYIDAQLHFILTQMQLILTLKTPYTSNGKDHIRNTELYRDLPKVSTRLRQAFVGHCWRSQAKQPVSELMFWSVPGGINKQGKGNCTTYIDTIV